MILAQNPAVAVIDVVMPHLDALGVMKAVHDRAPQNKTQFMVTINYENGVVERELLRSRVSLLFSAAPSTSRCWPNGLCSFPGASVGTM